jgi:long-chain acyl-CoA synthetase
MGISDRLRDTPTFDPEAPALHYEGSWRPWRYYSEVTTRLDQTLSALGVGKGAPVGLLPRNTPAAVAAAVAILAGGRCIVCVSPLNGDSKVAADIGALDLAVIVGDDADWQRDALTEAASRSDTITIGVVDDIDEPIRTRAEHVLKSVADRPGDALEMLTSGTTGPPRRVTWSYERLDRTIDAAARHFYRNAALAERTLPSSPDVVWTPMVHMSGMWTVLQCVAEGRKVVLLAKFEPHAWAKAVQAHKPKAVGLAPTAMRMVLDAGIPPEALASLKAVRSGSAPLPIDLQSKFEDTYGVPVLTVYGATEFAGAATSWTLADHQKYGTEKRGSSGRALPGVELRVIDRGTYTTLPAGTEGLLEVRMPSADWMRTSDVAMLDGDGFLWIRGREDDAILRGGFKVDPRKVERVLLEHPDVLEAAVVGIPDDRLGAVPAAVVVLRSDLPARATPDQLIAWTRDRAAPYEVPTRITIAAELPRTVSQKISRDGVVALVTAP